MPIISLPGRYSATVTQCQIGESSGGTPFIEFSFLNEDKDTITGWLYLSPAAIDKTFETLEEAFEFNGDFDSIEHQVKGRGCSIVCEEEEDDKGKTRIRVRWINAEKAPVRKVRDEAAFRSKLSTLFHNKRRATSRPPTDTHGVANSTYRVSQPSQPTLPVNPEVNSFDDEEVPF